MRNRGQSGYSWDEINSWAEQALATPEWKAKFEEWYQQQTGRPVNWDSGATIVAKRQWADQMLVKIRGMDTGGIGKKIGSIFKQGARDVYGGTKAGAEKGMSPMKNLSDFF